MSYDKRLRTPYQAFTEFGRAVGAGLGLPVNPVTLSEQGKQSMDDDTPRLRGPLKKRKLFDTRKTKSSSSRSARSEPESMVFHTSAPTVKRARMGKYHNQLGRRPGSFAIRRTTQTLNKRDLNDKTFNSQRLVYVEYSEDETQISKRRSRLANVRGLKLNAWFKIPFATATAEKYQGPIQVRWCIINPKTNNGGITLSTTDFFISKNPGETMSQDFPNDGDCFAFMNRRINKELYDVISQGMFVLHPPPENSVSATALNADGAGGGTTQSITNANRAHAGQFKKVTCNIPIRKQMKWANNIAGAAGGYPEQNVYFCWWYCAMGDDIEAKRFTGITTKPVRVDYEVTTYFTNSSMYR